MISITWRRNLVKSSDQKFLTLFQKIGDEKINLDCNPPSIFSILFLENEKQKIIGRKVSRNFRNEISPPIIRFLPVTRLEFAGPRGEREGKRREGRTSFRGAHTCVSTKIRSLNTGCGWNSSGSRHVPREPRHVRRFVDFFADSKAKTPRLCRVPVHSKRPPRLASSFWRRFHHRPPPFCSRLNGNGLVGGS